MRTGRPDASPFNHLAANRRHRHFCNLDRGPSRQRETMIMDRRSFGRVALAGVGAALATRTFSQVRAAVAHANNVVLVHGLFADGSSWSEVIPLLQARGLTVTSVQTPPTTLDEAVAATRKVLDRQDGPTVLAGHSFSGMIVTEAGVHRNV
jgi:pimeloyl-ACP methyl ester carboxylesterase